MTKYFTTAQVCVALGVVPQKLSMLISIGILSPNKFGPSHQWTQAHIDTARAFFDKIKEERVAKKLQFQEPSLSRTTELAARYQKGETLEAIGASVGLTRERVRQLISSIGITKNRGGASVKAKRLREEAHNRRDGRCQEVYGCTMQEFFELTKADRVGRGSDLSSAYWNHRTYATRLHIPWAITLPQYAEKVWPQIAGFGRGGLHLTRINKKRGFSIDNIEVIDASEHAKRVRGFDVAHRRKTENMNRKRAEAKRRFAEGFSREALAQEYDVSLSTISNWLAHEKVSQP